MFCKSVSAGPNVRQVSKADEAVAGQTRSLLPAVAPEVEENLGGKQQPWGEHSCRLVACQT